MRWVMIGSGALMILMGGVWTLQGIGVLPGSFMTGQLFWAMVGLPLFIAGSVLCFVGLRRGAAHRR